MEVVLQGGIVTKDCLSLLAQRRSVLHLQVLCPKRRHGQEDHVAVGILDLGMAVHEHVRVLDAFSEDDVAHEVPG